MLQTILDKKTPPPTRMKKDVYEHLARTFLQKKQTPLYKNKKIWTIFGIIVASLLLIVSLVAILSQESGIFSKKLSIIQDKTPISIKYDFTLPGISKVRELSFDLDNIDLSKYNNVKVVVRTLSKDKVSSTIKLQVENGRLEKDSIYIADIQNRWKKIEVPLTEFSLINDWSGVKSITLIVEDWNVSSKVDEILVDEISFVE